MFGRRERDLVRGFFAGLEGDTSQEDYTTARERADYDRGWRAGFRLSDVPEPAENDLGRHAPIIDTGRPRGY